MEITDELSISEVMNFMVRLKGTSLPSGVCATGLDGFAKGETVIIRTNTAGVWCGILCQKSGKEVILTGARRMWRWKCRESISLSGVAVYGIDQKQSRIAPPVPNVWLEAIEIIPLEKGPAESIMEAPIANAE